MMIPGRKTANDEMNGSAQLQLLLERGTSIGSTDSTVTTYSRSGPSPPPPSPANDVARATKHKRSAPYENPNSETASIGAGKKKWLPSNFVPGPMDVICARGKVAKEHSGNRLFRLKIQKSVARYEQAETKLEKSIIVSQIIESVRAACPEGGFVKRDPKTGRWFEVGDVWAR